MCIQFFFFSFICIKRNMEKEIIFLSERNMGHFELIQSIRIRVRVIGTIIHFSPTNSDSNFV